MVANVLCLCRQAPDPLALGGIQVHVADLARCAPSTVRISTAYLAGDTWVVETWRPKRRPLAFVPMAEGPADTLAASPRMIDALEAAILSVEADVLHVHAPSIGPRSIVQATDRLGIGLVLTIHDHSLVCEDYRLLEGGRRYCGIPADPARCDRCLAEQFGRSAGHLEHYRAAMSALVARADAIIAPTRSARDLSARVHRELADKCVVIPWGIPDVARLPRAAPPRAPDDLLRLAVVGVVATVKGYDRLQHLIRASRHLPVQWHLFGATEGHSVRQFRRAGRVVTHGSYARPRLFERLTRAGIHAVVLPSVSPETFSLTLSETQAAGLPALVSNLGALAERIGSDSVGWTFDPWDPSSLTERVKWLLDNPEELTQAQERARTLSRPTVPTMTSSHLPIWHAAERAHPPPPETPVRRHARERAQMCRDAAGRAGHLAMDDFIRRIRQSNAYRDFRLRTLLSESARRRAETAARRLFSSREAS